MRDEQKEESKKRKRQNKTKKERGKEGGEKKKEMKRHILIMSSDRNGHFVAIRLLLIRKTTQVRSNVRICQL
jgi:hypothetical protein